MDTLRELDVVRALTPELATEMRADGDPDAGMPTMVVRFSVFNAWYEIDSMWEGQFLERTAPGSFKRTIKNNGDQVKVLYDHGMDFQIGNKVLGSIASLQEESDSPVGEVELFDTSYVRDLLPGLEAGVYGSSFRFRVVRDEWNDEPGASEHNPKGLPERTIKEVRLFEFGPVTFPANPESTSGLRSLTDSYYERLRSRNPQEVDDLRARVIDLRTTKPEPADSPPDVVDEAGTSVDVPAEPAQSDPVERHSGAQPEPSSSTTPTVSSTEGVTTMTDTMTVEERAARQSEIRARLAEIDTEFSGAELPAETQVEWDGLTEEIETHERAIEAQNRRMEQLRALAAEPANRERGTDPGQVRKSRRADNIYDLAEIRQNARSVDELPGLYRDHAMRAVEGARFYGVKREDAQANIERLLDVVDDKDGTLAKKILVTGSPVYQRAFGKVVSQLHDKGLTAEEARALSLGVDGSGGYAVPFQLDPTVILTSDGVVNPLRSVARVEQIVGKEWQGITSAGITVSRSAESAEVGDDSFTIEQPTVRPTKVDAFVPFSIEIDQDWPALQSEITRMLADAKEDEEAVSFVTGTGLTVNPSGVVSTLDAASEVAAGGTLTSDDLYNLEEALPPRFRARARFAANRAVYNAVRGLGSANDGGDLWVRLGAGLPAELIGYSTIELSAMTTDTATVDSRYLLLGDFSQFLIVDRVGMSVELVPHLFATANNRPSGQRGIYASWRNSSKVLVDNAFRVLTASV